MPIKRPVIFITIIAFSMVCSVLFYSCTSLKNPPVTKNYFDLNIQALTSEAADSVKQGSVLLVKEFMIAPEFDYHSFVYRVGENEYTTDFYNEFASYPAKLISDKIKETLYASTYFVPFMAHSKHEVSYRLFGKITRLYGNMQDKNSPEAVMEIRFTLEKKQGNTFKKVHSRTYLAKELLKSSLPAQMAAGWGEGLKTILSSFLIDIQPLIQNNS